MKHGLLSLILITALTSCQSGPNLPSVQDSERRIAQLQPRLDSFLRLSKALPGISPPTREVRTLIKRDALNKVLRAICNQRTDDVTLLLLPTKPLWKEDKTALGISYTNYVDLEAGEIGIDLKSFRFLDFKTSNTIAALIELEGAGRARVSGKYMGVPGSAQPELRAYLLDTVELRISTQGENVRLSPVQSDLMLKAKLSISLLGLSVPYYKEIPLAVTELIKPIDIPAVLATEILFPFPAATYNPALPFEFRKKPIFLSGTAISVSGQALDLSTSLKFSP